MTNSNLQGLNIQKSILSILAIIIWISIFIGGILINSKPYRQEISNFNFISTNIENVDANMEVSTGNFFIALTVVIFSYTPSNLILLCMCSGLLGALSRIAKLHIKNKNEEELPSDNINPLMSGVLRGLFVYLLAISGILLLNDSPITSPGQTEYVRLAGLLSILSFLLSYNPSRFQSFLAAGLDKAQDSLKIKPKPK